MAEMEIYLLQMFNLSEFIRSSNSFNSLKLSNYIPNFVTLITYRYIYGCSSDSFQPLVIKDPLRSLTFKALVYSLMLFLKVAWYDTLKHSSTLNPTVSNFLIHKSPDEKTRTEIEFPQAYKRDRIQLKVNF